MFKMSSVEKLQILTNLIVHHKRGNVNVSEKEVIRSIRMIHKGIDKQLIKDARTDNVALMELLNILSQ